MKKMNQKHGSLLGDKKGEGSHFQLWQIAGVSAAAIITYYSSSLPLPLSDFSLAFYLLIFKSESRAE